MTPPPVTPPPGTGNRAPVANAGAAKTVATGAAVALDGSASSDPDGDALTFSWTLQRPATSAAALTGATTSKPGFVADVAGSYVATLTVNDGKVTASASVTITAQASTPTPPPGIDGAALYSARCSGCHGPINAIRQMPVSNRTATGIQRAIDGNKGGMGFLSTLTAAEVQAIAAAIDRGESVIRRNPGPLGPTRAGDSGHPPSFSEIRRTRQLRQWIRTAVGR